MATNSAPLKRYLGDGVYIDFDGYNLVLTTENGIAVTNRIVLEPEVHDALWNYVKHLPQQSRGSNGDK